MSAAEEYRHGGDIYRNPVEYDFSVNVNPLGMPGESLEAARQALLLCGGYPDWRGEKLCRKIARKDGVLERQIILGNGAAELIYALCFALSRPASGATGFGQKAGLLLAPSFGEYEAALGAAGIAPVFWNLKEEDGFFVKEGLPEAITSETGVFFFCNPNNPNGGLTRRELLCRIARRCEETGTFFCLDECFLPFLEDEEALSMRGMLEQFPHLIILRAFTKIYGMPGLRLGYALSANEELLRAMRGCMQPWNTSAAAQAAGAAALEDQAYLERTRRLIAGEREYLRSELEKGLAERVYPSDANFLLFRARKDLKELLLEQKVLIRSCADYRNLTQGYFRIGVRTHEENRELIRRWRRALEV